MNVNAYAYVYVYVSLSINFDNYLLAREACLIDYSCNQNQNQNNNENQINTLLVFFVTPLKDDDQDTLIKGLFTLREALNEAKDLHCLEPGIFLAPFLEIIRSEETTGPVTSLALSAVNKIISYGLIGISCQFTFHSPRNMRVGTGVGVRGFYFSRFYPSWDSAMRRGYRRCCYPCKVCGDRRVGGRSRFDEDTTGVEVPYDRAGRRLPFEREHL